VATTKHAVLRTCGLRRAQRALDWLNGATAAVSAVAIGLAGCVLTWEVIGRYFLGIPSDWQDELTVFLLVGATFGSASWIQASRGHVSIDAIAVLLPPAADRWRRRLADVVSLLFCSFFAIKSAELLYEAWTEDQTTASAWGPPLWIPYGCMAFGMALLSAQIFMQILAGSPGRDAGADRR
jgi:TRAP-type C4-dicarboxylate transport system permease small subunit